MCGESAQKHLMAWGVSGDMHFCSEDGHLEPDVKLLRDAGEAISGFPRIHIAIYMLCKGVG